MPPETHTCFLSYAREDFAHARELRERLTMAGIDVWHDETALDPGERWAPAIRDAIRNSRYFLALLSSKSVTKKGFVQREIREALAVLDEYPDDEVYLIPIRLDDCRPSHERLTELNWIDLFPTIEPGLEKLQRFLGFDTSVTTDGLAPASRSENATEKCVFIRFDGLYRSDGSGDDWSYLRFHDDGMVQSVSTTGDDPNRVAKWFNKENHQRHSYGSFHLTGREISFSATSAIGTVDYEGSVRGDTMILRSHSHINDYRGVTEYTFAILGD